MKKILIAISISLVSGLIAGAIIVSLLASKGMMLENESRFDYETTLTAIQQSATAAAWSIPIVHDLQKSMAKAGKEVNKVSVFELCKPDYAVNILSGDQERIYSNMMPCRVSVYTKSDGKTYVSRLNIRRLAKGMPKNVKATMKSAYRDMEKILAGIVIK